MFGLLRATAANWIAHKDSRLGAALAYYSIFSLGPIIIIAIAIAGLAFGRDAVRGNVLSTLQGVLGSSGAQAVGTMLEGVSHPKDSLLLSLIGLATLVFAAIGVVVQHQGCVQHGVGGSSRPEHPEYGASSGATSCPSRR